MYGPGGPYHHFRGRDISKAAAKYSTTEEYLDDYDLSSLTPPEKDSMKSFFNMLYGKYKIVGRLNSATPVPLQSTHE